MTLTQLSIALLFQFTLAALVAAAIALILAPQIAELLIRFRARRLPEHLAHRYSEEWIGEVRAITNRVRKLTFAIAISVMRSRTLTDAEKGLPASSAPIVLSVDDVRVYSEFGSRFIARLFDFIVMWAITVAFALALGGLPRPVVDMVSTSIILIGEIWLILRLGGTPGKLLMKLRIVTFGGEPLTVRHALFRVLPEICTSVIGYGLTLWAIQQIANASFSTLPQPEQERLILAAIPLWLTTSFMIVRLTWTLADIAVFVHSAERRALHDLIAGTVVIVKVPHVIGPLSDNPPVGSTSAYR